MKTLLSGALCLVALFFSQVTQAAFTAYNDVVWGTGELSSNITTGSPLSTATLNLKDRASGLTLPVQATFSVTGGACARFGVSYTNPVGCDAYQVFNGNLTYTNDYVEMNPGTVTTLGLTGLDSSRRYSLVLYGSRGATSAAYSARMTHVTLAGATLFTNNSTVGITKFTKNATDDSGQMSADNMNGKVFRFDGVSPGLDGAVSLVVSAAVTKAYICAFMVQEFDGPPVSGTNGPVLHYTFDEGTGALVYDQSGNGHTGGVQGAVWSGTGRLGGSIDFSASDTARVEVDLNQALYGRRALTISAWVKSKGNPGDWEAVMGTQQDAPNVLGVPVTFCWLNKRSLGNNAVTYMWLEKDSGGPEVMALEFTRTVDQFHNGEWYHVVMTWDGTTMKHFVNGALDSSMATVAGYLKTNTIYHIGGHRSAHSWANFNGYVDDLRVYDRALGGTDVSALYEAGSTGVVHYLDVGTIGSGTVDVVDGWFTNGAPVVLTATSAVGYTFSHWAGDVPVGATASNPLTVVMTQSRVLNAVFVSSVIGTNGPILHYTFDEGAGAMVYDQSGNGHTGTVQGTVWSGTGRLGGSMDFSASDTARVEVDLNQALYGRRALTISAWVKSKGNPGDWEAVMGTQQDAPNVLGVPVTFCWLNNRAMGNNAVTYMWLEKDSGGPEVMSLQFTRTVDQFHNGEWYHVVMTWDGTTMTHFVNGALDSSMTTVAGYLKTNTIYHIGGHRSAHTWANFNGYVDDLRVYDRALGGTDVSALYEGGFSGTHLTVSGSPAARGTPTPLNYGTHELSPGTTVTNSVASQVLDGSSRYVCAGWEGTGDVPSTGSGTSVVFSVTTNSTLTWKWLSEHYLDVAVSGSGAVDVTDGWYTNGAMVTLTATADSGYSFSHWVGNVSSGMAASNPLTVGMTAGRTLSAVFASSGTNAAGLLLHYRFDEGAGSYVYDDSGNGHTGLVQGPTWSGTGRLGGSMDFSASDTARVEVDLNQALYGRRALTISAWVKSKGNPGDWEAVMGTQQDAPNVLGVPVTFCWLNNRSLGNNAVTYMWLEKDSGGPEVMSLQFTRTVDQFHNGEWHHVVMTWDGTTMKHFVNGALDSSMTTVAGFLKTNTIYHVGGHRSAHTWANFNGYVDDLRVYDRAMSGTEVSTLYEGGFSGKTLTVAGTPLAIGVPTPNGYGTTEVTPGLSVTNRVASPVINGGTQYVCTGWTGLGDVPVTGAGTSVVFTVTTNSTLTWNWRSEYFLNVGTIGSGTVDVVDGWLTNGATVVLSATSAVGYTFSHWAGDVPVGATASNPLTVVMTQSRVLNAVFVSSVIGTNGPILHYTFDEGAGAKVYDQSGNGHTGGVQGAVWSGAGRLGGSMDFSASDTARVEVDLNQALYGKRAITISAWLKSKGNPGDWEAVMGTQQDAPNVLGVPVTFCWLNRRSLGNNAVTYMWLEKDSGGPEVMSLQFTRTVDQFHNGEWYHVVMTWDGTTMKHFVNGVLDSSMATVAGYLKTNTIYHVGGHRSAHTWANFNGYVDDLRVYDRALSGAEILALGSSEPGTTTLTIEGDPDFIGTPGPLSYGTHDLDSGTLVTNTVAASYQSGGTRFLCTGWSGEGSVPAMGSSTSVTFTLSTNSILIWQWAEEEYVDVNVDGAGTVDWTDSWVVSGSNVTVLATPDVGNYFTHWSGDVDDDSRQINPLQMVVTRPMSVTANFDFATCSIAGEVFGGGTGTVRVEACSGSALTSVVAAVSIVGGSGSYVFTNLPATRDYWVWAYADLNGNSTRDSLEPAGTCGENPIHLSGDVAGADISLAQVSAPTGLVAWAGVNSVTLSWEPNGEAGVVGYYVYRTTTNGTVRLTAVPVIQPMYVDSGLLSGSTPSYTVTALISVEGGTLLESEPSDSVSATVGGVVLWMPDYAGPAGSDVRLRVSAENIDDVLGDVMQLAIIYDPTLVTPLTQIDDGLLTVEKTILTEAMDVTDNGATAFGTLYISSTNQLTMDHARLWLLGCDLVGRDGRAVSIQVGFTNASQGGGMQWFAAGGNVNDGQARSMDIGALSNTEDCMLTLTTPDESVSSDQTPEFVRVLRDGDTVPDVQHDSDLPSCMLPYVDDDLVVNIGTNDALFCVELEGRTQGSSADYFDAVLLLEYNAGATLAGEGHLFDVLFRVASNAVDGAVMTNAITSATMLDRQGNALPIDTSDTALFTVQSNYILGDINGDGVVDVSGDFTLAMKIAVGQFGPTPYQLMAGDIDGDGVITRTDAVLIKRIIDGLDTNPGNALPGGGGWIVDPFDSSAATNGTLVVTLDHAFATPGSDGPVAVSVYGADAVAGLSLVINYDPSILTLASATNAGLGATMGFAMNSNPGTVELLLAASESLGTTSGVVATLQFQVNISAPYGALSPVTIAACDVVDEYGRPLASDLVHGSVTVAYSDELDSDGDGLSDFAEQFQDGRRSYSYWSLSNLYGQDSNLLDPDTDDDGMNDGNEVISGTSLTDSGDVLALSHAAPQSSNAVSVTWQSVTGHLYRVECSTNLRNGFVSIATGIVGQAGTTIYTDNGVGSRPRRLYRVVHE